MGTVRNISFDADDPEDCKRAVKELEFFVRLRLGPERTRQLFSEATPSRRQMGITRNVNLMALYVLAWKRRMSVGQFAAQIAKRNGSLPREHRSGPRGSTSPQTLEKHIRREKKRAAKDPAYKKLIESVAENYRQAIKEGLGKTAQNK